MVETPNFEKNVFVSLIDENFVGFISEIPSHIFLYLIVPTFGEESEEERRSNKDRQRQKETKRWIDRQRQRDRDRRKQKDGQIDREIERDRRKQRQKERE